MPRAVADGSPAGARAAGLQRDVCHYPVAEAFVPPGTSTQRFCRSTTAGSPPRAESLATADHVDALVLWAVGNRPNTGWFGQTHADKLTDRGLIHVDRRLRVDGWDSVFAIGDATDADPKKLVIPAVAQAKVAARNVHALLAGRAPDTDYRPARGEMLVVPVGPDDGVSVLAGLHVGGSVTRKLKSADLFVARYRKTLNLPPRPRATSDSAPARSR